MQWFARKSFLLLTHKTYFHCYIITVTPFVLTILNPFTTSKFGKIWPKELQKVLSLQKDGWMDGEKDRKMGGRTTGDQSSSLKPSVQ